MKGHKQLMSSGDKEGSSEWETDPRLYDGLDAEYRFDLDAACTQENCLAPTGFWLPDADALVLDWWKYGKSIWVNPPYGKGMKRWVQRAINAGAHGSFVIMLVPARTDTKWMRLAVDCGAQVVFLTGRLMFYLHGKPMVDKHGKPTPATFPSALLAFGLKSSLRVPDGFSHWVAKR